MLKTQSNNINVLVVIAFFYEAEVLRVHLF